MQVKGYIVWKKGAGPCGYDINSGGYPYVTDNLNFIHYHKSKEDAQDYCDVINKSPSLGEFEVRVVTVKVESNAT